MSTAGNSRGDGNAPVRRGPAAASSLLTPQESVLALIDHQGLMLMSAGSHDRRRLVNNVAGGLGEGINFLFGMTGSAATA